jgi:hypothetical protein
MNNGDVALPQFGNQLRRHLVLPSLHIPRRVDHKKPERSRHDGANISHLTKLPFGSSRVYRFRTPILWWVFEEWPGCRVWKRYKGVEGRGVR